MKYLLCMVIWCCTGMTVLAQVPETGRWQTLTYSSDEVGALQEAMYYDMIRSMADKQQINRDLNELLRVRQILSSLIPAASALRPDVADWEWELHLTNAADIDAVCFAGGKLLISSAFIRQMHLTDAELAAVIAHEIAHALAEHQREELSEALLLRDVPGKDLALVAEELRSSHRMQIRLGTLSYQQETEADQLGLLLAMQSGWRPAELLRFYEKLDALHDQPLFSRSAPAGAARLSLAKAMKQHWEAFSPPSRIPLIPARGLARQTLDALALH